MLPNVIVITAPWLLRAKCHVTSDRKNLRGFGIAEVQQVVESAQVDRLLTIERLCWIDILIAYQLPEIQQCMQNRTLARTVGSEEQCDRSQRDVLAFADAFEVFDPEVCDHVEGLCVREGLMVANGRCNGLMEGFS